MAGYDGRGARFNVIAVNGSDLSFTVTAVDSVAAAIDLSAATITGSIYNGAGTVIDTLTDAVSGAGSNIITVSLTGAEVDALVAPKTWALVVTRGTDSRTWLAGSFHVTTADRARTGTSGTAVTATVDTNVTVTASAVVSQTAAALAVDAAFTAAFMPLDVSSLTAEATVAADDDVVIRDTSAGTTDKATITNLAASTAFTAAFQPLDADLTTLAAGNLPTNLGTTLDGQYAPSLVRPTGGYCVAPDNAFAGASVSMTTGIVYLLPFEMGSTVRTLERVGMELTATAGAGGVLRFGVVLPDANGRPLTLLADLGTTASTTTTPELTGLSQVMPRGLVYFAVASQVAGTPTARGVSSANPTVTSISAVNAARLNGGGYQQTSVTGAFPATFPSLSAGIAAVPALGVYFSS